jgi:hypothetical protein
LYSTLKGQFTVCVNTVDVLPTSSTLPEYTAVMACDPCASNDVVNVAFPLTSADVPKDVAPSFSVTEPVGVPPPGATATTVTLNVTVWPNVDGFGEDVIVVELAALLTVCVSTLELLVL